MSGKEKKGRFIEKVRVGTDQILLRFEPVGPIFYEEGQFLSLKVPFQHSFVWRPYSFASSLNEVTSKGCELFIKYQDGGATRPYLESLTRGDIIHFRAPYGEFKFHPGRGRPVVFISTGTGLAPIRSIAFSEKFQKETRAFTVAIMGFQKPDHIPNMNEFDELGIDFRYALSRECPGGYKNFFPGRVIQFLHQIPNDFDWTECDYYLCGNTFMIQEVTQFLRTKGVSEDHMFFEAFEASKTEIIKKTG